MTVGGVGAEQNRSKDRSVVLSHFRWVGSVDRNFLRGLGWEVGELDWFWFRNSIHGQH